MEEGGRVRGEAEVERRSEMDGEEGVQFVKSGPRTILAGLLLPSQQAWQVQTHVPRTV